MSNGSGGHAGGRFSSGPRRGCERAGRAEATDHILVDPFMLISESPRTFDLYVRERDDFHPRLDHSQLLSRAEYSRLLAAGSPVLYVRTEEEPRFLAYVERRIGELAVSRSFPLADRCRMIYELTETVMRRVLLDPDSDDKLARAARIARTLGAFVAGAPESWAALMEVARFEPVLSTHSVNVCFLSAGFGAHLFCPEPEIKTLSVSGLLHDVGMRLPSHLHKDPAGMDETTRRRVKIAHADAGADRCREVSEAASPEICSTIRQHHERANGSGYPRRLRGREIHQPARIVAAVDMFSTLAVRRDERSGSRRTGMIPVVREKLTDKVEPHVLREFLRLLDGGRIGTA